MKTRLGFFLYVVLFASSVFALDYRAIEGLESKPGFPIEHTPNRRPAGPPVQTDLAPFYQEMEQDGVVTFYLGIGAQGYSPQYVSSLAEALRKVIVSNNLPLTKPILYPQKEQVQFSSVDGKRKYLIQIGKERNDFMSAFKRYDIVMYGGHSRYGRGPAFEQMSNYVRIGDEFDAIEVDTRNPYFLEETILKTAEFPLIPIELGGTEYQYQYIGAKDHTSELSSNSYTKNVPGMDVDLQDLETKDQRQIYLFNSCSNEGHWRKTLRNKFPETGEKVILGTIYDAYVPISTFTVMILQVAMHAPTTLAITQEMNQLPDTCTNPNCYTSY